MDPVRFDSLTRSLVTLGSRRAIGRALAGLGLGAVFAPLVGPGMPQVSGKGHGHHHKKKKKKHKKKPGQTPGGDTAPPCTDASCPLPPGCSQQAADGCTNALIAALQVDAQACLSACHDGDSPTCRACLGPILSGRLPDAAYCVAQSCFSSASTASHHEVT